MTKKKEGELRIREFIYGFGKSNVVFCAFGKISFYRGVWRVEIKEVLISV